MANSGYQLDQQPPAKDPLYDESFGADATTRLRMSFARPEFKRAVLEHRYGKGNVGYVSNKKDENYGELVVKEGDRIFLADESIFSFKDFVDMVGYAPEILGQITGGLIGTTLGNLPGGVAGAVGGGAAGDTARQGIAEMLDIPNPPGFDTGHTIRAGARGLAGEVGGWALAKTAGRAVSPLRKSMTPEAIALKEEAEALGMPYTTGDITKHRGVVLGESTLDKMLGSAGQFQRLRSSQLQKTGEIAEDVLGSVGGKVDLTDAGNAAKDSMLNVQTAFKNKARELYDEVERLSAGETIETPNLLKVVNLLRSQDGYKTLPGSVRSILNNIESRHISEEIINGVKVRTPTAQAYGDLRILRSELGKKGASQKVIAEKGEGAYKLLRNALESDLETWGKRQSTSKLPEWRKTETWENLRDADYQRKRSISDAMKKADDFYRLGDEILPAISDLKGQLGKKILNTERPEEITRYIFKPNNFTNIVKARKLVGEEGFQTLKRAFLTDILEGAKGRWTTNGNIEITFPSARKLDKFFKDYDLKTMRFIFGDEALGRLNQLRRMVDLSGTAQIMAANPSGTGQIVLAGQSMQELLRGGQYAAGATAGLGGSAAGMAAPFAGPWAIAKTILSKPAKKYMTSGARIPSVVQRGLESAGLLGGSLGTRGLMGYDQIEGIK